MTHLESMKFILLFISLYHLTWKWIIFGIFSADLERAPAGISRLFDLHLLIGIFLFVCTIMFFPEKPENSASKAANVERINFSEGLRKIVRSVLNDRLSGFPVL